MELIGTAYAMGIETKIKANGDGARLREKQDFRREGRLISPDLSNPAVPVPWVCKRPRRDPVYQGLEEKAGLLVAPAPQTLLSTPPPAARSSLSLLPVGEEQKQRRK